jgi:hypothetical protein
MFSGIFSILPVYNSDKFLANIESNVILGLGVTVPGLVNLAPKRNANLATQIANQRTQVAQTTSRPDRFNLEQNYPNPFNPSPTIRYERAAAGQVCLTVYDVLGEKVADLLNTRQNQGRRTVTFDAGSLANGVYFVRLQATAEQGWHYDRTIKTLFLK